MIGTGKTVAWIDEARCIGCTLCLRACPVDAIVGAAKLMHKVIAAQCTGCDLCLPPCPVDCIEIRPATAAWTPARAAEARRRIEAREKRVAKKDGNPVASDSGNESSRRKAVIAAALARAAAKRAAQDRTRT